MNRPLFFCWRSREEKYQEVTSITTKLRVNHEIRARQVRVVDSTGEQLGIMPLSQGLKLAEERGQDLVEVAPKAAPPVCRIMDYGKYKYEQSKREREARKKQKVINIKEVRMSPKIDDHDFDVRLRNAEKFLKAGDKVKVTVRFRGREIVHADLAGKRLQEFAQRLQEIGQIERAPVLEGRNMFMILAPVKDKQREAKNDA